VNPITVTRAAQIKGEFEGACFLQFGYDIKKYHNFVTLTKEDITKQEGNKYNEYARIIFKTYKTAKNGDFKDMPRYEEKNWMLGKMPATYNYPNLMEYATALYNSVEGYQTEESG